MAQVTYVINIPVKYNWGAPIEEVLYDKMLDELVGMCGGYTFDKNPKLGAGDTFAQEPVYRLEVDVVDKFRFNLFMRLYCRILEFRFFQECIWLKRVGRPARLQTLLATFFVRLFPTLSREASRTKPEVHPGIGCMQKPHKQPGAGSRDVEA